nr:LPS export ABC transporter periplasmic protein LptC [Motiliproteus sediminis]
MPRYTRRLTSLVLVGTVTGYWGFSGNTDLVPEDASADADRVDSYLGGAEIRQFGADGALSRTLTANHIEHRTAGDHYFFIKPTMQIFRPGKTPLQIRAQEAESNADQTQVELRRSVRVEELATVPLQLHTERLMVIPGNNFAWTPEPVAYYRGDSTTLAVGMNAYLDQNRIELLNDVRGHYETR